MRYVPQEATHDTLVKVNTVYKTQRVYDSVGVKEQVKGDTVRVPVPVECKAPWWERRVKPMVNHVVTVAGLLLLMYCLYG